MNKVALDKLIGGLRRAGVEFSAEDLADALWLAPRLPQRTEELRELQAELPPESTAASSPGQPRVDQPPEPKNTKTDASTQNISPKSVDAHLPTGIAGSGTGGYGVMVQLPGAAGVPDAMAIARAMRPFRRRQETRRYSYFDESKTAERIAASDIWLPVLLPGKERWLDAAVVIDSGASMALWQTVLREFQGILETLGAFRRVQRWWLDTEDPGWTHDPNSSVPLFVTERSRLNRRNPLNLVDTARRQFILVISDCVSDAWWDGRAAQLLALWGRTNHTAILQMLPENMWERTAIGSNQPVMLRSFGTVCPNSDIDTFVQTKFRGLVKMPRPGFFPTPVLELNAASLGAWSRWVALEGRETLSGRTLETNPVKQELQEDDEWAQGLGQPFLTLASKTARKLASVMAVAPPFNLPLLRVIRESMLGGEGTQAHEAEFLLGGLVKVIELKEQSFERPDEVLYDFRTEELRQMLRAAVPVPDALNLLRIKQVSQFLGYRLGHGHSFSAYLESPANYTGALPLETTAAKDPIARFTADILQWFGGEYAGLLVTKPTGTGGAHTASGDESTDVPGETIELDSPELLRVRALEDPERDVRIAALQALARRCPDETTRELLAQRSVQDESGEVRSASLQTLTENWPDEATRELLVQRSVQDNSEDVRGTALQALAERWPDESARTTHREEVPLDRIHSGSVAPSLWILVAGTGSYELPAKVLSAAEHVGKWLAENRYGLITGGWPGVDHVAARSYANSLYDDVNVDDYMVHVVTRDRQPDFNEGRPIKVTSVKREFQRSIELADGVILIGGLGGTRKVGLDSLKARTPVFPLDFTDGDAKFLFEEIQKDWANLRWLPVSRSEFAQLSDESRALDAIGAALRRISESRQRAATRSTIVFVDDDRYYSSIVTEPLKRDFEITSFTSAEDARQYFLGSGRCDLVVIDLMMPPPAGAESATMDGLETGRWLLEQIDAQLAAMRIPVILLSNRELEPVQAQLTELAKSLGKLLHFRWKSETTPRKLRELVESLIHREQKATIERWQPAEFRHLPGRAFETLSDEALQQVASRIFTNGIEAGLSQYDHLIVSRHHIVGTHEIDAAQSVHKVISDYCESQRAVGPLSIAVFGPPGVGKSWIAKQIIECSAIRTPRFFEFNIAQLTSPDELGAIFTQLNNAEQSEVRIAIFSEFDCSLGDAHLGWIRYFLAPMQDGNFERNGIKSQLRRSILVFISGTRTSFDEFMSSSSNVDSRQAKLPDFVSRLRAYLNVPALNATDNHDKLLPVRRAIVFRQHFEVMRKIGPNETLKIDSQLVLAFLEAGHYRYGARSISAVVESLAQRKDAMITAEDLPPQQFLQMHIDDERLSVLKSQAPTTDSGYPIEDATSGLSELWDNLEDGTNVAKGTVYRERLSITNDWYRPQGAVEEPGWEERLIQVRQRFQEFSSESRPVGCLIVQKLIPQLEEVDFDAIFQGREFYQVGGGPSRELAQLEDTNGGTLFGLFAFKDVKGKPIENSAGEPFAFRLGLSRVTSLFEGASEKRVKRRATGSRFSALCQAATELLYQLPARIAERLWRNWYCGFSRRSNSDEFLWINAVFEFAWQSPLGQGLHAKRHAWNDDELVELIGTGLFPRIKFRDPHLLERIPNQYGYPVAWHSTIADIGRASVEVIDRLRQIEAEHRHSQEQRANRPEAIVINPEITNLQDIVTEVSSLRTVANSKKMTIDFIGFASVPLIRVDRAKIETVFQELLLNAIKYGNPGTRIVVSAEDLNDRDDVTSKRCVIRFQSFGTPINSEEAGILFSPGFRGSSSKERTDGTGIGLYMARSLTRAHGGDLRLTNSSSPTEFTVALPYERSYSELAQKSLVAARSSDEPEDADFEAAKKTFEEARHRPYYVATADAVDRTTYYSGISTTRNPSQLFDALSKLVRSTHKKELGYKPAVHLYPWVDLQPNLKIRSIYSTQMFEPLEFIARDLEVARLRRERLTRFRTSEAAGNPAMEAAFLESLETELPYNCEHVVPQSWFQNRQPMKGDLHHLFACESKCNSFRSNTPYFDFTNFGEAIRSDCGKSETNKFEPNAGKGAVARATLYFLLRYPGEINSTASEYTPDRIQTLVQWHQDHPVTDYERHRNQAIFAVQGNRNPLVDQPDWVQHIELSKGLG